MLLIYQENGPFLAVHWCEVILTYFLSDTDETHRGGGCGGTGGGGWGGEEEGTIDYEHAFHLLMCQ